MGKRILVLAGSPRRHGNTDCLADEFIQGAQEAGHETEKIYLKDKKINGWPPMLSCWLLRFIFIPGAPR